MNDKVNNHYETKDRETAEAWADFWAQARKLSQKKEQKLKPAKEKTEKRAIRAWMRLYYKRWDSILHYENFKFATVPDGAWDRVGRFGMSDDGDCVYDHNWRGKHGSPLYDGWVLEHSVPKMQKINNEHIDEEEDDPPILQVIGIIPTKAKRNWVGLGLSDGDFVVLGLVHPQLECLVKKLRKFTIIKVHEYHIEYNPSPIVIIKSMEIWNDVISTKIRTPKDIAQYYPKDVEWHTTYTCTL